MLLRSQLNSKKRKCDAEDVEYVSTSTVELDTFSFLWSIQNFSGLDDDVTFYSPIYCGGPKTNHSWKMYVKPNAMNTVDPNDKEKYLSVFLTLSKISGLNPEDREKNVKASYEISLLDKAGELAKSIATGFVKPHEYTEGHSWGNTKYVGMTSLKAAEVLFDDKLTIHCRVSIHLGFEHSIAPGGRVPVPLTEEALDVRVLKQLRLDFKAGFETEIFTDMTLVTKTKVFKVHKFVLAARSPVFKAMLSSNCKMPKAIKNSIRIEDFDIEIVKSMLRFVYTGEITALSTNQACDLLRMADKYKVLGLKEHLEEFLGKKLSTSNVLKVLATAEMHGASRLKETTLHFTNKYKGILRKTAGFKELVRTNPNLINDLYQLL